MHRYMGVIYVRIVLHEKPQSDELALKNLAIGEKTEVSLRENY